MVLTLAAVLVGMVGGLLAGGRPRHAGRRPVRATSVLLVAVVLQLVPTLAGLDGTTGLACVLASYVLLVVFALANVRLVGMGVVLVGLTLNLAVIAVNGGMPVDREAVLTADHDLTPADLDRLDFDAKRHLEDAGDRLTILGDRLPIAPLRGVVSFGDLVLAVGVADVAFRLLKPAGAKAAMCGPIRSADDGFVRTFAA